MRVEIYRMNDAAGAMAVFTEMTAGMSVEKRYGTSCVLDDYQVLFLRGDFLISLTTYEKSAEAAAAMAATGCRDRRGAGRRGVLERQQTSYSFMALTSTVHRQP